MSSVLQSWVEELPMMQQSVLLTAVRGPDGLPKYHSSKYLLRWYRRCILLSAMDGKVLDNPWDENGGSFTGPSLIREWDSQFRRWSFRPWGTLRDGSGHGPTNSFPHLFSARDAMSEWVSSYLRCLDEVPHHFQLHFMHGVEIIGYQHPDGDIGSWWYSTYLRLVADMHLRPEPKEEMMERLSDNRDNWLKHADSATTH